MAGEAIRPGDVGELRDAIADAARDGRRIALRGGGSKAAIGAPRTGATLLDMRGFAGIIDHDPAELVITAGAGTPLATVKAAAAAEGQMLAFEPFDHGPLFGAAAGAATIGGIVAAGISGSRRLSRGAARDHLLGFTGVTGGGEPIRGGARVVKNVTGYDLPKLVARSWGRLIALTDVTLRLVPRPRDRLTMALRGLDPAAAVAAMARALGSAAEIAAAAHLPAAEGGPATLLRLEGFAPSVAARAGLLAALLADFGDCVAWDGDADPWPALATITPLGDAAELWCVDLPAAAAAALLAGLDLAPSAWLMDWGGGRLWIGGEGLAAALRPAAAAAGGHATLVRAPEATRRAVPALHPLPPPLAALEARVRAAFDPAGVFATGRFPDIADAH